MKNKKKINESIGLWGLVAHTRKNLGLNEQDPSLAGRMPSKTSANTTATAPKPQIPSKPKPPVQRTPVQNVPNAEPEASKAPAPETAEDYSLNYKVGAGYKVKFAGKPGEFYIVRVMDGAMKNFLVANKVLGIKQFYNVRVESIISDEHNKPYKTNETPETTQEPVKSVAAESLMESFNKFIRRIR